MQLNKYLALCGIASRRKANYYIAEGRVSVNSETVVRLGRRVDPEGDIVELDGKRLTIPDKFRYVLLNKPVNTITAASDARGRITVLDLIDDSLRLFPVGRLDLDTEGVLLITNDGDLAYRLTHPKYEILKIYRAWVKGRFTSAGIRKLAEGVSIEPHGIVRGEARILEVHAGFSIIDIRVHEGKKRQIKRMLQAIGHPVQRLIRIRFAGLTVGNLGSGEWRELAETEIDDLYRMCGLERKNKIKD
jgi:23S rRNA pseudouridine2605 synthase